MSNALHLTALTFLALTMLWTPSGAVGVTSKLVCELPNPGQPAAEQAPTAAMHPGADNSLREGWPVSLGTPSAGFPYTPMLFDVDHDGADEIFLTGGHTFGLRGDGTFLPGWPTVEMPYMGYGTNAQKPAPSAADLAGDGDVEILWSERDWWAGSAYMWSFNGKNVDGSDLPGFPQQALDEPSNALDVPFVLGDTDGDGRLEAWGPHTLGNAFVHYRLSAFDEEGTRLFTVDTDPDENLLNLHCGDIDGNGAPEMFSIGWLNPAFRLHVYASNGTEQPEYPITLHTLTSGWLPFGPPVPVDLDGDGDLEILIGYWDSAGSRVLGYHHDGSALSGFPIEIASSSQLFYIGLGDVTGDGVPELIVFDNHLGAGYRVHVIDMDTGVQLAGWPLVVGYWPKGFPTVVDVDNDGHQDICFVTDGGQLFAVGGAGQVLEGYPKFMVSGSISGVAAGDIDNDGLYELVAATWDGWIYAWDTTGEVLPGRADWPMRGVNARNTGIFGDTGTMAEVETYHARVEPDLRVSPNPVQDLACFSCVSSSAQVPVVLEIFDPSGRLLHSDRLTASHTVQWRPPSPLTAGVYTARAKSSAGSRTVRFVVAR